MFCGVPMLYFILILLNLFVGGGNLHRDEGSRIWNNFDAEVIGSMPQLQGSSGPIDLPDIVIDVVAI